MYIEARGPDGGVRVARIARVRLSKSGRTIYYDGREFRAVGRAEYLDTDSGETYLFSGPRKDGNDRGANRSGSFPIEIDEEVRREYWRDIRGEPERVAEAVTYG
jgi:hypothetical protein